MAVAFIETLWRRLHPIAEDIERHASDEEARAGAIVPQSYLELQSLLLLVPEQSEFDHGKDWAKLIALLAKYGVAVWARDLLLNARPAVPDGLYTSYGVEASVQNGVAGEGDNFAREIGAGLERNSPESKHSAERDHNDFHMDLNGGVALICDAIAKLVWKDRGLPWLEAVGWLTSPKEKETGGTTSKKVEVLENYFRQSHAGLTFFHICDAIESYREFAATKERKQYFPQDIGIEGLAEVYVNLIDRGFRGRYSAPHQYRALRDYRTRLNVVVGKATGAGSILQREDDIPDAATPSINSAPIVAPDRARFVSYLKERIQSKSLNRVPLGNATLLLDENGVILGPQSEGTTAIIALGISSDAEFDRAVTNSAVDFERLLAGQARAVRIPRLLSGNLELNYQLAERCFFENAQAAKFAAHEIGLANVSVTQLHRTVASVSVKDSDGNNVFGYDESVFVGLYLSPGEPVSVGLVGQGRAWPDELDRRLSGISERLYEVLKDTGEKRESGSHPKMIYIPRRSESGTAETTPDKAWRVVSREGINSMFERRERGGWWFMAPVASSSWLTADLQRMLNALVQYPVSDSNARSDFDFRKLNLREWFRLAHGLASGLKAMHELGCVHGDIRPANIMKSPGPNVATFQLIDLGMGFSEPETPRATGGGRTSIFYAPERVENFARDEVDVVTLKMMPDRPSPTPRAVLEFKYKPDTLKEPIAFGNSSISSSTQAAISIRGLQPGDRVGVHDVLFDIESNSGGHLVANAAYEHFLGRFEIRRKLDDVVKRIGTTAVGQVRIVGQWGQASDIYSLGCIVLYMFFMRGVWAARRNGHPSANSAEDPDQQFSALVNTIRDESFIDSFLWFVHGKDEPPEGHSGDDVDQKSSEKAVFETQAHLLDVGPRIVAAISSHQTKSLTTEEKRAYDKLKQVFERTSFIKGEFVHLYYGLNCSCPLFVKTLYFVIRCVWRKSDLSSKEKERWIRLGDKPEDTVGFEPFCQDRLYVSAANDTRRPEDGAEKALAALEDLELSVERTLGSGEISPVFVAEPPKPDPTDPDVPSLAQLITQRVHAWQAREQLDAARTWRKKVVAEMKKLEEGGLKSRLLLGVMPSVGEVIEQLRLLTSDTGESTSSAGNLPGRQMESGPNAVSTTTRD